MEINSIPNTIVIDNGKQFDNANFKAFCFNFDIKNAFFFSAHPQANGQVVAVNKIIKENLKVKLESSRGHW